MTFDAGSRTDTAAGHMDTEVGGPMERSTTIDEGQAARPRADLHLRVDDPEIAFELLQHPEGAERDRFALAALRIGILALRQANGSVDAGRIHDEAEQLIANVRTLLAEQSTGLLERLAGTVSQYFDPETGLFGQRVERLICRDGELETVLRRHLEGETSSLARTMIQHVGENSPLLKSLSPTQSDGLLAQLRQATEQTLQAQQDHVVRQFSLDDPGSALSRLVVQITDSNGKLRRDLASDIQTVQKEFSLDSPDSALSRLVRQVDDTTKQVRTSLTLDDEASPLALLRKQVLGLMEEMKVANAAFYNEVRTTLAALQARRAEADRSNRRGMEFEAALSDLLSRQLRNSGDLLSAIGTTVGVIPRCKIGDFLIELGPESAAPGARIVIEAKEHGGYDLRKLVEELGQARENREAQVGVGVMSRATAPEHMETLTRIGSDIIVVWDRDDELTDVMLTAALSLARGLAVRERGQRNQVQAELSAIEDACRRIAKSVESLSEILTTAETVRTSGIKIHDRAQRLQDDLNKQLEVLRANVDGLKADARGDAAAAA